MDLIRASRDRSSQSALRPTNATPRPTRYSCAGCLATNEKRHQQGCGWRRARIVIGAVNGAAASLLLALWCLVCALRMSAEPSTHDSVLLALLLSPLLFTVGARARGVGRARAGALSPLTAAAQATVGAIAIAGAVWLFFHRSAPALVAVPAALAIGLGLAVDDLRPDRRSGTAGWAERDAAGELAIRAAHHGVLGALLAVILGETLGGWIGWMRVDATWRDTLLALVVGGGIGGAGGAALRFVSALLPAGGFRALAVVSGVGLVAAAASWAQSSAPLAALVAGLCGPAEPQDATREDSAPERGTEAAVRFLASAGILLLLSRGITLQELQAATPGAFLVWAAIVLFRALVQAGVGGVGRLWLAPECPGRWLAAIAWTGHPGALSAALILWWTSQTRSAELPPSVRATVIEVLLLSLSLQGATALYVLSRAARSPATAQGFARLPVARWKLLRAKAIALQSHEETAEQMAQAGRIDEAAAQAIAGAAQTGLRAIEAEIDAILRENPTIRQSEIEAALRELLSAAIDRVKRAAREGGLDRAFADQVAAALERERVSPSLHTLILRARGDDDDGMRGDGGTRRDGIE